MSAQEIPVEPPEKRADIYIPDDKGLIEVKTNEDLKRELQSLQLESVVTRSVPMTYSNAIDAIIDDASKQLTGTKQYEADYRLIWYLSDDSVAAERFGLTFYGLVHLVDLAEMGTTPNSCASYPCYGFRYAAAYNNRAVDAAVVQFTEGSLEKTGLLLNPFANNSKFKESRLYAFFQNNAAITDPQQEIQRGDAFVVEENDGVNLGQTASVLAFVRTKYRRPRLIDFEPVAYSASMMTPKTK